MKLLTPFVMLIAALSAIVYLDDTKPPAELVFVNRGEVFTLDPQRMSWMQDFRMAYALYEGLVRWNNSDFTIEPAAATSWDISDDAMTYTFQLRDDARWSNGDPVTAHDFIYSWSRAILPDSAADYSNMFFAIEGAIDYFQWRASATELFAEQYAEHEGESKRAAALELWNETQERFDEMVALHAVDDYTLEVRLAQPIPYFLDLLAFGVWYPVHRPTVEGWIADDAARRAMRESGWHAIKPPPFDQRRWVSLIDDTAMLDQQHGWTKPGVIVTNGPYVLTQWRYMRGMRLERNPSYHSPSIVNSDTIDCVSFEDVNTSVLAFEKGGDIDWLSDVNAEYQADMLIQRTAYIRHHQAEFDRLIASGLGEYEALARLPKPGPGERRNVHVFPTFGTDFYSFNCRPTLPGGEFNPFADARIRRAFVQSVDRQAIVERVTRLNEPVVTTFVPIDSIPGYENPTGLGFNPEAARSELRNAGWEDRDGDGVIENKQGEPFPIVDLLYSTTTPRYKNISLALRDMWQRELKVQVELRGKDNKFFKEDLKSGNFMIGRGRWYGDYGDPTTFLDICKTGDGNNDRGYSNAYVDSLLEQAAVERDPQERMLILAECERFLFQEEVPMLVLCQLVQLYMYEPGELRGLTDHPRLVQYLWQLEAAEQ